MIINDSTLYLMMRIISFSEELHLTRMCGLCEFEVAKPAVCLTNLSRYKKVINTNDTSTGQFFVTSNWGGEKRDTFQWWNRDLPTFGDKEKGHELHHR